MKEGKFQALEMEKGVVVKLVLENDHQIQFASVKNIVMNKNDILCVKLEKSVSLEEVESIKVFFKNMGIENKVVFVMPGISLEVIESK
ncbi:MAG: hypothetical protein HKM05_00775 [Spirochaetales bacterium]|nr:hypothetical protein [Spirochaetales bacterium]